MSRLWPYFITSGWAIRGLNPNRMCSRCLAAWEGQRWFPRWCRCHGGAAR